MSDLLVSVAELQRRREQELSYREWTIIDARPYADFEEGHIPDAIHMHPGHLEQAGNLGNGARVPHMVADTDAVQHRLRTAGIGAEGGILIYDAGGEYTAARLFWILSLMGRKNLAILDGGFTGWLNRGGETSRETASPPRGDFLAERTQSVVADFGDMLMALSSKKVTLVNTLDAESFEAGAIPGSVNLSYRETFDPNTKEFLPTEELKGLMMDLEPADELVFYCGIGYTAAQGFLAARIAGYTAVRVYDGSIKDWSARGGDLTPRGMMIDSE